MALAAAASSAAGGSLLALLVASLFASVAADTPANCTYQDALGVWRILETERFGGASGIRCGPGANFTHNFTVTIRYPDLAVDSFGNVGFWTLVYNQGIEIRVAGRKYYGFFQWRGAGRSIVSVCNRLVANSTSHDVLGRNWACFAASHEDQSSTSRLRVDRAPPPASAGAVRYRRNPQFVRDINAAQSLWRAAEYPEYELSTLADLHRRAGGPASRVRQRVGARPPTDSQRLVASLLPDSWDWRSVDGVSYVSPVRNQASCGSCYSFSSTGMIESRLKILSRNTLNVSLSEQDVVECSPYSQGCEGGFPYLVAGKFAEDYGLALEDCNPYRGSDGVCRTKRHCRRVFATDYRYVGGYYGACSEAAMRVALVNHGPMSVSFEVYSDFMHYKSGIYRHTGLVDRFNPFEITNHAVLLVGYGVDRQSGVKYWIVKNSWGTSWGEGGYFRIVRGEDECAIESIAVESFPIMP